MSATWTGWRPTSRRASAACPTAPGVKVRPARPVPAPPAGDPLAATVFLFYEVENHDRALRPGQRVGVTLPLSGDEDSLAVPRSALIRDALGGTWVYENIAPHVYRAVASSLTASSATSPRSPAASSPAPRSSARPPPSCTAPSSAARSSSEWQLKSRSAFWPCEPPHSGDRPDAARSTAIGDPQGCPTLNTEH